jgi:hypothetical protein
MEVVLVGVVVPWRDRDGARRIACATAAPAWGPRGRLKEKCAASAGGRTGVRGEPPGPLQERRRRATQWSATRPARERVLSPLGIPWQGAKVRPRESVLTSRAIQPHRAPGGCRSEGGPGGREPGGGGRWRRASTRRRPHSHSTAGGCAGAPATERTAGHHVLNCSSTLIQRRGDVPLLQPTRSVAFWPGLR